MKSYKSTVYACYLGIVVQAIVINLTPVLFVPLKEQLGLAYGQLGILVLVNFFTQVICDVVFSPLIDRLGFRKLAVLAPVFTTAGFLLFAASPVLFPGHVYTGIVIATVLFAGSGGIFEVVLSPMVNAIPTKEKTAAMSVLHSFYCWGQVMVVLVTTFLLFVLGRHNWQIIVLLWLVFPVACTLLFLKVPIAPPVAEHMREKASGVLKNPFFILCFLAIAFGGAAEITISQWISSFMEKGMNLPKVTGDVLGMCLFAALMGVGRLFYGIYGKKINVCRMMLGGSAMAFVCYMVVALTDNAVLSLAACALCGLGVSLLWPGTLSVAAGRFPLCGSWLFAVLSLGGALGNSFGPWLTGVVVDNAPSLPGAAAFTERFGFTGEAMGLHLGMLVSAIFPLCCLVALLFLARFKKKA